MIIDEATMFTKLESSVEQLQTLLYPLQMIVLSGTPVQSRLTQFLQLISLAAPRLRKRMQPKSFKEIDHTDIGQSPHLEQIREVSCLMLFEKKIMFRFVVFCQLTGIMMIRRNKSKVLNLPTKTIHLFKIRLSGKINSMLSLLIGSGEQRQKQSNYSQMRQVLSDITYLKKCPKLVDKLLAAFGKTGTKEYLKYPDDEEMPQKENFFAFLDDLPQEEKFPKDQHLLKVLKGLQELQKPEKMLIFYHYQNDGKHLLELMNQHGFGYVKIDGQPCSSDGEIANLSELVHKFKESSSMAVALVTFATGAMGLNFTEARNVYFYGGSDVSINVHQAIDRTHRIGQTKPVHVYQPVVENSVEELVFEHCQEKLSLHKLLITTNSHLDCEDEMPEFIDVCKSEVPILTPKSTYADVLLNSKIVEFRFNGKSCEQTTANSPSPIISLPEQAPQAPDPDGIVRFGKWSGLMFTFHVVFLQSCGRRLNFIKQWCNLSLNRSGTYDGKNKLTTGYQVYSLWVSRIKDILKELKKQLQSLDKKETWNEPIFRQICTMYKDLLQAFENVSSLNQLKVLFSPYIFAKSVNVFQICDVLRKIWKLRSHVIFQQDYPSKNLIHSKRVIVFCFVG